MNDDKLKESIITEEELNQEEPDETTTDIAFYPRQHKTVRFEVVRPSKNAQLYNIEEILTSALAILLVRKEREELSKQDWKRLKEIVDMKLKLTKLDLVSQQTSLLEGKTDIEIHEMARKILVEQKGAQDDEE